MTFASYRHFLKPFALESCCRVYKKRILFFIFSFGCVFSVLGQSLSLELKTTPQVDLVFNTIEKYKTGIRRPGFLRLNILAVGTEWDLYVGAQTDVVGSWNVIDTYGNTGLSPTIALIELQFRNASNTSQEVGFFSLTDIASPTYIIGSANIDPLVLCPNQGCNGAGSYLTTPGCFKFDVDMRVIPNFDYKPGLYTLTIQFVLTENL